MLKTSSNNNQVVTYHEFWLAVFAGGALVISIVSFFRTRRQIDADAMLPCFKILSDPRIKYYKKIIAEERRKNIAEGKSNYYNRTEEIEGYVDNVISAYNQVSALYQLKLLNNGNFKFVYGDNLVRTWHLLSEDIERRTRAANIGDDYAKHFRDVATKLINEGVEANPY